MRPRRAVPPSGIRLLEDYFEMLIEQGTHGNPKDAYDRVRDDAYDEPGPGTAARDNSGRCRRSEHSEIQQDAHDKKRERALDNRCRKKPCRPLALCHHRSPFRSRLSMASDGTT